MIKYLGRIQEEVEKITEEESTAIELVLGEQKLITKYPTELNNVKEFVTHVKFYRENVLRQLANFDVAQKFFKSMPTG